MRKSNWKIIVGGIAVVLILGALFYYPRIGKKSITTDIPCLAPNVPLTQHIHPVLTISEDGVPVIIPANTGLEASCEHALHTHDATGAIHVEAQDKRQYTLGDFYSVWGQSILKSGWNLEATVSGKSVDINSLQSLVLKDKQQIVLKYARMGGTTTSTTKE